MEKTGGSKILLGLFIFFIIIAIYTIIDTIFYPNIILKNSDVVINLNSEYNEPGYKAYYKGKDITDSVSVYENINTRKLGVYKIKYSVSEGSKYKNITRKVYVKDLTKPQIKLTSNKDIYVCPDDEYIPNDYKAYDNIDKDITNKVKVIRKGAFITYLVKDSAFNEAKITKRIHYKDKKGPTIKFNSGKNPSILLNNKYDDKYTVVDNCTKNVKAKVYGKVDTTTPGNYKVKYTAEDEYGNKTVKTKKVNVYQKDQKGTIYLTFDDGPNIGTTDKILDILKEENVKATFFVTNRGPDYLIKREYDEGHTVGLHTATHDYSYVYSSVENYFNDLASVHDRVYRITGYDSRIIRFPGGSDNTISRRYKSGIMTELVKEVLNRGYKYYDWNILSGDAGETKESSVVYQMVTENLSKDRVNIVLMHDIKPYTRDALKNIIEYGKANGYHFEKITMATEMVTKRVNN